MTGAPGFVRIITWLPVGGIERRLVAVVPRLVQRGWRASVVLIRERGPLADELEAAGVPVRVIPFRSRVSPAGIRALAAHLRDFRADIVHSHMYRSNVPAAIAGRLAGTRAILAQIHNVGTWESKRQLLLDRQLARLRTGHIAVSEAVKRDVVANLRVPPGSVHVLHNGIDTQAFAPDEEARGRVRAELALEPATTLVLVPARLHPQKNPLGMLEAFAAAASGRDAVLAFAGAGSEEKRLRAASANLGARVRLLGERHDMAALYNAADIVALPSFKEGFSNAVIEALSCGRPVLATDVGGNAEAITAPAHGWIVPPSDPGALAGALAYALDEGARLAERGAACRARGLEFGIDALVDKSHALYCAQAGIAPA